MGALAELYATQAFWIWIALAAALLAAEVATGSGWLLWPSASAALVGVLALAAKPSPLTAVLVFAGVTIVATLLSRRFLRCSPQENDDDINDNIGRLVGRHGEAVSAFVGGSGRVFIDGKEWAAELEEGQAMDRGARVIVAGVSGAHLRVREV